MTTTSATSQKSSVSPTSFWQRADVRRNLNAYAFIIPFIILFIVFNVGPFFWALWLSLLRGDLVDQVKPFVGIQNYLSLTTDDITLKVFRVSFQYTVSVVPIAVITALAGAFLLGNKLVRFKDFYRAVVFFPLLASAAATAQIWSYILAPSFGVMTYLLGLVGIPEVYWLSNPKVALYGILLIEWWRGIGFHIILFLAAMLGVPEELQEAARIDGANAWQVATRVTIPLMRPVILFSVVMGTNLGVSALRYRFCAHQWGPCSCNGDNCLVHLQPCLPLRSGRDGSGNGRRATGDHYADLLCANASTGRKIDIQSSWHARIDLR